MATTQENLQRIIQAKANIKEAIIAKGVQVGDERIEGYADLIGQIAYTDPETLAPERLAATIVSLGGTNVSTNKNIKIYADNRRSYTCEEWYALEGKGTDIKPIGWDINAWGYHFVWYHKSKYRDDANTTHKTYYDVSGSVSTTAGGLRHSQWQHPLVAAAYTKNDINGTTAKATVDGDELILSTTNSPFTWRMKAGRSAASGFIAGETYIERFEALVAQTEWFRHRAAIDSGLATSEEDGTMGVVTIVKEKDENDQDQMYFYVNGIKTDKLAKYNLHSIMLGDNPTQAIIDAIYDAQLANGTNMNVMCLDVNLEADAKPVVTDGAKGAEAYAYNGKWMIVTPVLSRCNATLTFDYNIPDAPAVSYALYLRDFYENQNITLPNEQMLQAYWVNRNTIINSMTTFLNSNAGGNCGVPASFDNEICSAVRFGASLVWYVSLSYGNMTSSTTYYRYSVAGASAL